MTLARGTTSHDIAVDRLRSRVGAAMDAANELHFFEDIDAVATACQDDPSALEAMRRVIDRLVRSDEHRLVAGRWITQRGRPRLPRIEVRGE